MLSFYVVLLGLILNLGNSQLIGNTYGNAIYETGWTLQAELRVAESESYASRSPMGVYGRGFLGLISGYDDSSAEPGIYIHTTDDGTDYQGRSVVSTSKASTFRFWSW